MSDATTIGSAVAIVGMAGRFPRARSVTEFWKNIRDGIECISHFSIEELEIAAVASVAQQPGYVRARGMIDDADMFDASFFGILPKEAELIDPQQRVFLECCWEALEDAGYDPQAYAGAIGVYAGASANTYFLRNLCANRKFIEDYTADYQLGHFLELLGANHDFLATRVSYKLNLKGPAFTLQCGCSTSLVAVCQACQSLLNYQADMALAGGVSITFPQKRGYLYEEGGMGSADGHCRPFDADARGTVFGSGAAVVLLKRLEDALAERDHIYAVIRGYALNNDGSAKIGYTAPGPEGQAEVIALAQGMAGVKPETISYVEAHGTATPLGDPIEFTALERAFREQTTAKSFCALGTVKANVGHLDIAAGATGLINVANMLTHEQLPPAIHFRAPNEKIDLATSPFYVNQTLAPWPTGQTPRRAGVSAFGVGGTNAHVVVEEAPVVPRSRDDRPGQLLLLSARSAQALEQATDNLIAHLKEHPTSDLADVAFTLAVGRRSFEHRRAVVATDVADAIRLLESRDRKRVVTRQAPAKPAPLVFMFPGQGSQYANMAADLYRADAGFRADVDHCCDVLAPLLGYDPRTRMFAADAITNGSASEVNETGFAQPALFVVEYSLARFWMRLGVQPQAMIGHSVGELVAACLADVFTLDDALAVIAARGRMMQELPAGGMLAVRLPEQEARRLLRDVLSLAAVNSPELCVVSGPHAALDELEGQLRERGVGARRLATSHAFHSSMMEPIVEPFTNFLRGLGCRPPKIPFISGVSGQWITDQQATDPAYWARHFREPVRFSAGLAQLMSDRPGLLLEVGPGNTLCTLARQHRASAAELVAVASLADDQRRQPDRLTVADAVGRLWVNGVTFDWNEVFGSAGRRCSLPTYPFERKRYWIEPSVQDFCADAPAGQQANIAESPLTLNQGVNVMSDSTSATTSVPSRPVRLRAELVALFEELSGLELQGTDPATTFLEMGFDSLFLTQITQSLRSKFGVKITFRQLLDTESTFDALAAYLDNKLPAEAFAPQPAPPTAVAEPVAPSSFAVPVPANPASAFSQSPKVSDAVAASPITTGADAQAIGAGVESLLREQLRIMSQQLDVLRGLGATAPQATVAQTPPAPVVVSPVAAPVPSAPALTAAPELKSGESTASPRQEFKSFGPYKTLQKGTVGGLTEEQSRHLGEFIKRYTARTAKSKEFTQRHRRHLADPRVAAGFRSQWKEVVYPIVTVRSQGSRLWDLDGNEYIDILNGFGPIMLGHRPSFVTEAVEAQLQAGFEIGPQTVFAGDVAELVCELTGMERATFTNTGSEAVMAAIRLARTVTGREEVVLFAGAYHGTFDEVLVKGVRKQGAPHSLPIAPGIPNEKVAHVKVLELGSDESLEYIRAHAQELAAVLVEPVQSRHPDLQPVEFLRELRRITQDAGAALIFDEVVTGFRVHPGGAQALFGIRADMATYGKVIGGGLPIGILAGSATYMDALDGGMWQYGDDSFPETGVTFFAGTFVRHPLALAAAKSVLLHLKEQGPELQRQLTEKTTYLANTLNAFFAERGVPTRIEHFGSIFYFSFPTELRFASLLYYYLRERGVHVQEGFPCFLTTAHSDADVEFVIRAFRESVLEMQAFGALPAPVSSNGAVPHDVAVSQAVAIDAAADAEVPLTESQLEIWLSARLSDDANCAYNESFTLHLRGPLNEAALGGAVQQLVARHDALRSTFDPEHDCIRIRGAVAIGLPTVDLSATSPEKQQEAFDRLVSEDAARPFDLEQGLLVRVSLVRFAPDCHSLLFTSHHIVCDGWSTNVLLDELCTLYNAACAGKPTNLPAAARFADYARSQATWVASGERAGVANWWAGRFKSPVVPMELPLDRPRGSLKSFRGATARTTIGTAEYQHIKRFGAKQGCTLFSSLLAGFEILLARLSHQYDVVVGIPAAGQSIIDDDALVGHCVNFLPLRSTIMPEATVAETLRQIKAELIDAYEHQSYTYGSLVRKLALPRDPSRLPLVEVQFNLERVGSGLSFSGLKVDVDPNAKSFVNFDLFLNVVESDAGLILDCDYNSDLFDRQTIERWLDCYKTLLNAVAADPSRPIGELPLVSATERQTLLQDWNNTAADFPREKCLHQLFAQQVHATPDAVAVEFDGQQLTYDELDVRANQLAHYLQKLGVTSETTVAIALDRSLELLVGVLGILKSGAAYVPLDPGYPRERIAAVLEDARPAALITTSTIADSLGDVAPRMIQLDRDRAAIDQESHGDPDSSTTAENLAYLIYTSGSTGKPKGVQISHRALVNLLCSMRREPGITADDRLLAVTTLSFDIAGLELFLPLIAGARVVIAPRHVTYDGGRLRELIESSGATVMQATPATWRMLIEAGWPGTDRLKVLCGGEALPRDLAEELVPRGRAVWNMYGPTETTIWSATSRVTTGAGPVTIGPPIANTTFYVLDERSQLVPMGVAGQLHIGGEGLARGYWNQPALTAEKFIDDPFCSRPGARLYKTGDLVRYLPDATLEFLGRMDTQVKVRGFRIETSEVESVLLAHPGVRQSAVVAREDNPGDKRLVAYVVATDAAIASSTLRSHVATKLPDYMVPSVFVMLPALPLTPNGKVDRRALPRPDISSADSGRDQTPASDAREELLVSVCREVLGKSGIGVRESLFDLGADSLHVFQIVARAGRAGLKLAPQQIMQHRTIAAICAQAAASVNGNGTHDTVAPRLAPVPRDAYRVERIRLS